MLAKITSAGITDIGKKREANQDQFLIADLNKSMLVQTTSLPLDAQSRLYGMSHGKLFMVADGMGGHQGGHRASMLAIDLLITQLLNSVHWFFQVEKGVPEQDESFIEDLKSMLRNAHLAIENEAMRNSATKGMGTTLTMAYVIWPWMYVVHAGDSRCYLLRDEKLQQLTRDHTISNQLFESGGLTRDEANASPWSNVLYNALGAGASGVEPEVQKIRLEIGDQIMLCSDGLYRYIGDSEIAELMLTEIDPHECCRLLVEMANLRGGADNITAIVARLDVSDQTQPKTRVAAEITLERLLGDMTGYHPPATRDEQLTSETMDFENSPTTEH
ncbi:MAG: serine/threonine-protein phosphatase [Planctomycetales bacterium]|nr:serine/threonine-protein phosphatase [Planctomycetales bacterium]